VKRASQRDDRGLVALGARDLLGSHAGEAFRSRVDLNARVAWSHGEAAASEFASAIAQTLRLATCVIWGFIG
jgi:hypothetical protein